MMIGISGTSQLKFSLVDLVACAVWITGLGLLIVGIESLMS